jgi:hypothetical protein
MRLLQSVLPMLHQTKKPQQKFVAHLLRLLLMLPGHATFRNLSRYSSYHERTFSRWYARDWVFAKFEAGPKSFHSKPLCAFAGCVHVAAHTPYAESA